MSLIAIIFMAGWVGTERMFYLRAYRGRPIGAREALGFTRRFMGRYIWLGLATTLPMILFYLAIGAAFGMSFGGGSDTVWAAVVPDIIVLIIWDVMLTFVTPALAYSTPVVGEAFRVGVRMLRAEWPATAWYALVPPLAIVALTYLRPVGSGMSAVWWIASGVATLLNLLAKGATAAFYLRRHPEVGDDGAAFMQQESSAAASAPSLGTS